jgi:hypothetical protein
MASGLWALLRQQTYAGLVGAECPVFSKIESHSSWNP